MLLGLGAPVHVRREKVVVVEFSRACYHGCSRHGWQQRCKNRKRQCSKYKQRKWRVGRGQSESNSHSHSKSKSKCKSELTVRCRRCEYYRAARCPRYERRTRTE